MTALVLQGQQVDLSVTYDAMSVYPRDTAMESQLIMGMTACGRLVFVQQLSPREEVQESIDALAAMGGSFDRTIHRDDDIHNYYHQDGFDMDRTHWHVKFHHKLTRDQFIQLLSIFVDHALITEGEKQNFLYAFDRRVRDVQQLLDALRTGDVERDTQAIIRLIGSVSDNDKLTDMHTYLASTAFNYLRKDKSVKAPQRDLRSWQGTDQAGRVVPSNAHWVKIEKALSLQMAHNIQVQSSVFSPAVGHERAAQFSQGHPFFGVPRRASTAKTTNSVCRAFDQADTAELDRKYRKMFEGVSAAVEADVSFVVPQVRSAQAAPAEMVVTGGGESPTDAVEIQHERAVAVDVVSGLAGVTQQPPQTPADILFQSIAWTQFEAAAQGKVASNWDAFKGAVKTIINDLDTSSEDKLVALKALKRDQQFGPVLKGTVGERFLNFLLHVGAYFKAGFGEKNKENRQNYRHNVQADSTSKFFRPERKLLQAAKVAAKAPTLG